MSAAARPVTAPVAARIEATWRSLYRTKEEFLTAAGISWPTAVKYTTVDLPPNHPFVPAIAKALKISVDDLVADSTTPPLPESMVKVIRGSGGRSYQQKNRKAKTKTPGKGVVHVPREASIRSISKSALKRLSPRALQLARTLATSTNLQIMQGKQYLSLPNMPVDALALLLADYFEAKGVPGVMLLNPDFAEIFG